MTRPLAVLMLTLLAACGSGDVDNVAAAAPPAGFRPPAVQPPAALAGLAQSTPLTAHVGRNPSEAIDGVAFFDRTEVATALADTVPAAGLRRRIISSDGPEVPVFRRGDRIAAHGCAARDCAGDNWTVLVAGPNGISEVCHHDARSMGRASRWYTSGPAVLRPGACPTA